MSVHNFMFAFSLICMLQYLKQNLTTEHLFILNLKKMQSGICAVLFSRKIYFSIIYIIAHHIT